MDRFAHAPLAAILISTVLCGGCSTPEVQPYPPGWPSFVGTDRICSDIDGHYKNLGKVSGGGDLDRTLSSLLLRDDVPTAYTLRLQVKSKNTLLVEAFDASGQLLNSKLRKNFVFSCNSGKALITWSHGGLDMIAMYVESGDLELHRASDGSLVVEKHYSTKGLFLMVVPVNETSQTWIRFERIQ